MREEHSAHEIQAEVHRLIHERRAAFDAHGQVVVPLPVPLPVDGTGLNWWMTGFGNAIGYEEDIRVAITEVGRRWNLAP